MSAISCSRSFCRSSRDRSRSSRLGMRRCRILRWCFLHMVITSFRSSVVEKRGQSVAKLSERVEPGAEHGVAGRRQGVRALRRARKVFLPLRGHEPLVLERAKGSVDVADVHTLIADEVRQRLEELVAVRRTCGDEEQQRRLAEALDPGAYLPAPVREPPPAARSVSATRVDVRQYMLFTYVTQRVRVLAPDHARTKGQTTRAARFASMPASSVANESENFCTPSDSSVAVTSS